MSSSYKKLFDEQEAIDEWEFVFIEPIKDAFISALFFANRLGRLDFDVECFCGRNVPIHSTAKAAKCVCGGRVQKVLNANSDLLVFMLTAELSGVPLVTMAPKSVVKSYDF